MRNVLMLILSFLLISSVQTTRKDTFVNEIKNGYALYEIIEDEENEEYSIVVARGINKGQNSLGLYFYSVCKDEYYCSISDGTNEYKITSDKNDEVYYPAISYASALEIKIYNCDDELKIVIKVAPINQSTFVGEAGGNNGVEFSAPKGIGRANQSYVLIYMIGIGIIVICAIIIIILKASKRGMFNDDARKEGITNFKELEEHYVNSDLHEDEFAVDNNEYVNDVEEQVQVYERTRDYDDDIDTNRPSVKSILEQRGFETNYAILSVEDKNKVMVELMMMREQKVINNDEYQHEIVELWKK